MAKLHLPLSACLVLACWFSLPRTLFGGTLTGSVKSTGNRPLPGVTVLATGLETQQQHQGLTDEVGIYKFSSLAPAKYRLEFSLKGFETLRTETVVGTEPVRLDLVLKPSGTSNSPNKNANPTGRPRAGGFRSLSLETAPNLEASQNGFPETPTPEVGVSAQAGTPAESRRDETFLIQGSVSPGVQGFPVGAGRELGEDPQEFRERMRERFASGEFGQPGMGSPGGGSGGSIGGGSPMGGGGLPPMAAGGPGMGGGGFGGRFGQLGANRLRGMITESHRNSVFNARQFSFSGLEQSKLPYHQNNFGASLGGPFKIPNVYNGSDRSSFFVSYQGTRSRSPSDTTVTVPTQAERNGDFSQTMAQARDGSGPVAIYDPALTSQSGTTRQFVNNMIPEERISPTARGLLAFVPLPNLPGNVQNYRFLQNLTSDSDMFMTRFNTRLSRKDNLSIGYSLQRRGSETGQSFPGFTTNQDLMGQNVSLSLTHNFTNRFINNLSYRFNRMRTDSLNQFAFVRDVTGELGITGVSQDPLNYGVPTIRLTNHAALQDSNPTLRRDQTSHVSNTVTYVRGKHSIRTGFEFRRIQLNNRSDPNGRGTFVFNGSLTSAMDEAGNLITGSGYDLADFLLGLPQSTSIRYGTNNTYFRGNAYNLFVQDNWRVLSQLTLNFGLRYELATPFIETQDRIANLDVAPGFAAVSVVLPGSVGSYSGQFPRSLVDGDRNNFAPRFGLAWKPFPQRSTVIRSGYGVFYNASIYNQLYSQLASQPPFAFSSNLVSNPNQVLTLNNGFPISSDETISNSYAVDRHLRVGYVQQWNLDVQHNWRPNLVVTLSYSGSKGTKLDLLRSPNRQPVGSERLIAAAQEFFYQTSGASSVFHSFNLRMQRRFTSGLALNGGYIYGRSIDNASSIGGGQQTVALIDSNLRAERGLSTFDMRHQATLMVMYQFPFGGRRRFLSQGGTLSKALGGWSLMTNATLQSGSPYTARVMGSSIGNSGTTTNQSERADATGLPVSLSDSERTTGRFFNTEAFAPPVPERFGNAGRNTIAGPETKNVNLTLLKAIPISSDGRRLEFRAQATNVFNTPNFSGLGTVVDSSNYGRLTSVKQMRQMEFSLRLNF